MPEEWLSHLPYPMPAVAWVLGSALLFILGGLLLDLWPVQVTSAPGRLRRTLERDAVRFWMGNLPRAGFYLGLPYLALISGALELDALGLGDVPTPRTVAWFLGAGAAGLIGLTAIWTFYLTALGGESLGRGGPLAPETAATRRWGVLTLFPEALYAEAHWAFYRSVPYVIWGDPYWAAAAGAVLVAAETYFNPVRRRGFARAAEGEGVLFALGVTTVTATAYAVTGSAWLALPLHLALRWAVLRALDGARGRLARRLQPTRGDSPTAAGGSHA